MSPQNQSQQQRRRLATTTSIILLCCTSIQDVVSFQSHSGAAVPLPSLRYDTAKSTNSYHVSTVTPQRLATNGSPLRYHNHHHSRATASTSTQLSAFGAVAASVDTFLKAQPFLSAFIMCSFKASAADLMAQSTATKANDGKSNDQFNSNRNLAFFLYGGLYQGMFLQFLYSTVYSGMSVMNQVLLDVFLVGPLATLPVAYLIRSLIDAPRSFFRDGLRKYQHHITSQNLLRKYWSLWLPVQFLTFGIVPDHLRVPFVSTVSFFWMSILSSVSSQKEATQQQEQKPVFTYRRSHPQTAFLQQQM